MFEVNDNYVNYIGSDFITVNAMNFEHPTEDAQIVLLAEELKSLLYQRGKSKVAFSVISEGLPYKQLDTSHKIIKYLIDSYSQQFNIDHFKIISGATPCAENLAFYKKHCENFGWIQVSITFVNWWEITRHHIMNVYKNEYAQIDITPKIKSKKFLCYNRMCKMHRMYITTETINRNLLDKAYFSNYFTFEKDGFNLGAAHEYLPTKYKSVIDTLTKHKDIFPIDLGLNSEHDYDQIADRSHGLDKQDIEHYNNSYFGIVTETKYFHDDLNFKTRLLGDLSLNCFFFTEKTYKFINSRLPFILVGITGSLEILKRMGYKTFHPFINESYDQIVNDEERLDAIMNEVERLCNLSDYEMLEWQNKLIPILNHNYEVLLGSGQQIFTYLPKK